MKKVYLSLLLGIFSSLFGFVVPISLSEYIESGALYFIICTLIVFFCSFVAVYAFDSYFNELNKDFWPETFGLYVGMLLPVDVINAWCMCGPNYFNGAVSNVWGTTYPSFMGDRQIVGFANIQGVLGFRLTGTTSDVYLAADGFLEFMNDFNKKK